MLRMGLRTSPRRGLPADHIFKMMAWTWTVRFWHGDEWTPTTLGQNSASKEAAQREGAHLIEILAKSLAALGSRKRLELVLRRHHHLRERVPSEAECIICNHAFCITCAVSRLTHHARIHTLTRACARALSLTHILASPVLPSTYPHSLSSLKRAWSFTVLWLVFNAGPTPTHTGLLWKLRVPALSGGACRGSMRSGGLNVVEAGHENHGEATRDEASQTIIIPSRPQCLDRCYLLPRWHMPSCYEDGPFQSPWARTLAE